MTKIKFRGMDANGIMRYGRLSQDKPGETTYYNKYSQRICWDNSNIPVSNKTLGQFIGLLDKDDKEIYEGDILKYSFETKRKLGFPYTESKDPGYEIWEIKYIAPSFVYIIHSQHNSYYGELPAKPRVISLHYLNAVEVIGNIYTDPELLKQEGL